MKKSLAWLIIGSALFLSCFAAFAQKTPAQFKTDVYNNIRTQPYNPARAGDAYDAAVNASKSFYIDGTASGTNTYAVTVSNYAMTAYVTGQSFRIQITNANSSGTITLNVTPSASAANPSPTALGAIAVKGNDGNDLAVGDIKAGGVYDFFYNGTNFRCTNVGGSSGSTATTESVEHTSSFTISTSEARKYLFLNSGSAIVITIPDLDAETIDYEWAFFVQGAGGGSFDDAAETVTNSAGNLNFVDQDNFMFLYYYHTSNTWHLANGSAAAGGGTVETLVAGNLIDIDATDPANPTVSVETGDKGDVTLGSNSLTIDNNAVTNAKINDVAIGKITGFGTGIATALAINTGSAGAPVLFNGAGGTPSSITLTNGTGTASGLTAGNVTTNANLTGHVTSTGNAAVLGSFSSANLSTALTDEVGTGPNGFARTTLNTQTASYTLAASDEWKEVQMNNAGATNLTLPPDATVPVGFRCTFRRLGAGQTTFVNGSGVTSTFSAGVALDAGQYNLVDIFKDAADHYEISNGSGASGAPLTAVNSYFTTNIGGSPSLALLLAASVGVKFTGITGSLATGDLVQVSGSDTWSSLASVSAGSMLRSGGVSTVSAWSTTKWPNTSTANRLLYSSATNTISESANLTYDGTLFTANGGTAFAYAAKTTTYTLTSGDRFIECTSGTFTVTLPTAVGRTGIIYTIDNSGAGTITLATTSSQTIDGASPGTLTTGQKITIYSNGANWRTF